MIGLEVLFSKEEFSALGTGILVAHGMKHSRQRRWPTKEHANICVGMLIRNAGENPIPIWPAKVSRSPEGRDRIFLRANVLHNDIVHIIVLYLGSEVDADLNPVLCVLFFDGV